MTRFGWVMTTYFALLVIRLLGVFPSGSPKLIWNASASVPIGLYAVRPAGALRSTELVVVTAARRRSRASSTSATTCRRACRC